MGRMRGDMCLGLANGDNSFVSCGGADGQLTAEMVSVGIFEMAPAQIGQRDGWTVLSENIRVKN